MASTEQDVDAKKIKYLSYLRDAVTNYVYLEGEEPATKSLRASMIKDLLQILDAYGLSVNVIYQHFPEILSKLFIYEGPGNEVRDILLQQGFDINTRTKDGQYPLLQACEMGNAAVAQYLVKHGATSAEACNGHTPIGFASAHPEFNIAAMEADPDCKEFVEQYHLLQNSMLLAHRWSINGYGQLVNEKFQKLTLSHPTILRNSLCQSFMKISETNTEKLLEACRKVSADITEADLKQVIENISARYRSADEPDLKTLADKIAAGVSCPLAVGTEFPDGGKHHEDILFYDTHKFIRVNRGDGSDGRTGIEMNTVTKPENIAKFIADFGSRLQKVDAASFHAALEEQLGLQKIRLINMKEQAAPTCKWTSEKALLYSVIYSELLALFKKKGIDESTADSSALSITRGWYKGTTKKDRFDMVKTVLDMFPGKNIQEMPMMLKEILYKIYHRSKSRKKYPAVVQMLDAKGMGPYYELNQQFLEALKKENEETLLGYIDRDIVGNQPVDYIDSVLYIMVERRFHKATKALLDKDTSPNPVPPAMTSILYMAIKNEDLAMVDLLLSYGAEASHLHLKDIDELRKKAILAGPMSADLETDAGLSLTPFNSQLQLDKARTGTLLTLALIERESESPKALVSADNQNGPATPTPADTSLAAGNSAASPPVIPPPEPPGSPGVGSKKS